jgi:carbon storage regulator
MLVLSRKAGESIKIGNNITIVINRIAGNRVTIGLDAPRNMRIIRGELRPFEESELDSEEMAIEVTAIEPVETRDEPHNGSTASSSVASHTRPRSESAITVRIDSDMGSYLSRRAR